MDEQPISGRLVTQAIVNSIFLPLIFDF